MTTDLWSRMTTDLLWTIDVATIRQAIDQRNALRRSARLPLLDEAAEYQKACDLIIATRHGVIWDTYHAEHDRIFHEVCAERGPPIGSRWMYGVGVGHESGKRYRRWLWQHHADELAQCDVIAPNYLAITRETVLPPA